MRWIGNGGIGCRFGIIVSRYGIAVDHSHGLKVAQRLFVKGYLAFLPYFSTLGAELEEHCFKKGWIRVVIKHCIHQHSRSVAATFILFRVHPTLYAIRAFLYNHLSHSTISVL